MPWRFSSPPAVMLAVALTWLIGSSADAADRLALIIGNDRYEQDMALPSCVNDARAVAELLRDRGFGDVRPHTNVTRQEFESLLNELLEKARREPCREMVIYYSGHGVLVPDQNGDEAGGFDEAFLCVGRPVGTPESVLMRDDHFFDYLGRLSHYTDELIVILDACHSGGLFRTPGSGEGPKFPVKEARLSSLRALCEASGVPWPWDEAPGLPSGTIEQQEVERASEEAPSDLDGLRPETEVLYFTASTRYQQSMAGNPNDEKCKSKFTGALLEVLTDPEERGRVYDLKRDVLTLDLLHQHLKDRLRGGGFRQTPVLLTRGGRGKTQWLLDGALADRIGAQSYRQRMQKLFAQIPDEHRYQGSEQGVKWQLVSPHGTPIVEGEPLMSDYYALRVQSDIEQIVALAHLGEDGSVTVLPLDRQTQQRIVRLEPGVAATLPKTPFRLTAGAEPVAVDYLLLIVAEGPVEWLRPDELARLQENEDQSREVRLKAQKQRRERLRHLERILGGDRREDDPRVLPIRLEHQASRE